MKWLCLIFLTFVSSIVFAEEIDINSISINCGNAKSCSELTENFKTLKRNYSSINHLQQVLKLYIINEGIQNFNYIIQKKNDKFELKINLTMKKKVIEVKVDIDGKAEVGFVN